MRILKKSKKKIAHGAQRCRGAAHLWAQCAESVVLLPLNDCCEFFLMRAVKKKGAYENKLLEICQCSVAMNLVRFQNSKYHCRFTNFF
jgi:hypothetical protein